MSRSMPRKEHDATLPRVVRVRRRVEVAVVQRHGERAVAERGRPIDELRASSA